MGRSKLKGTGRGNRRGARGKRTRSPLLGIGVAVIALGALVAVLVSPGRASAHPTPRLDAATVQVRDVVPASAYAAYPRVAEVYREAAQIPEILDGLYCYCDCSRHSGHYSLLDCFKSDHGAGCDICLSEAALAYKMAKEGKSLDQIRSAVDALYGGR